MPQVPTLTSPRVQPNVSGGPQFATPQFRGAEISAQQQQQTGAAMSQAGAQAVNIYVQMQEQANALRVDDALNQARERALRLTHDPQEGYRAFTGIAALERESEKPLADEFVEAYDGALAEIAGSLGNDAQRQLFTSRARALRQNFYSQATDYEAAQYREYNLSVHDGTISLATNAVGLNWDNPESVRESITSIEAAVAAQGSLNGKSATWIQAQTLNMTSAAHASALQAAFDAKNLDYAEGYIQRFGGQMTDDLLLRARATLNGERDTQVAFGVASEVFNTTILPAAENARQPLNFDRMVEITEWSESRGNEDAISPAGARGPMQLMPGTQRDPGFGVRPAVDDSAAENRRVGRDYLQAMLRRYGGDTAKAWAAYNWGPGNLDAAVAEHGPNWLQHAPQETRNYVRTNTAALSGQRTPGQATPPRPRRPTLAEGLAALRADPRLANDPDRLLKAEDRFRTLWRDEETGREQRDEEAVGAAFQWLADNDGDFDRMPQALRQSIPPTQLDSVATFARGMRPSAPAPRETDEAFWYELRSDPERLKEMNLAAVRNRLSESDFQQMTELQMRLRTSPEQTTEVRTTKQVLDGLMVEAGLDPTPDVKDRDGSAQVARVWRLLEQNVAARQRTLGRPLTATEVQQEAQALFQPVALRSWMGGRSEQPLAAMSYANISRANRDRLRQRLVAGGIPDPSEQDILDAYVIERSNR